jgi:uncharacterized protein (DUF2235 family)
MKRLVFCFDGTWNRLDAPHPTNVVLTAESVVPIAGGIAQLIFYDEGVGTGRHERFRGGLFGAGLVKNLGDAYRFLIFNYTPGDEIYAFGFSRGAYTARSFVGLIYTCGILQRRYAGRVNEAIDRYKRRSGDDAFLEAINQFRAECSPEVCVSADEEVWRVKNVPGYQGGASHPLRIRYVGVWDTVGSLGIPARYRWLSFMNRKERFHDTRLSSFVESARHAVAIDERRKDFEPTLWDNVPQLNGAAGTPDDAVDARYQQKWFPGVHGSVGGGGERRGLSDQAMDWVLDGARHMGLVFDSNPGSRIYELAPLPTEYLENCAPRRTFDPIGLIMQLLPAEDRKPGPASLFEVSLSARRRWWEPAASLPEGTPYRPPTLARVASALDALNPADLGVGAANAAPGTFQLYRVERGDTLRALAKKFYGDAGQWDRLWKANLDKIENPDLIYIGQILRIPR